MVQGNTATAAPSHPTWHAMPARHVYHAVDCQDFLNLLNQQCADRFSQGSQEIAECRSQAMADYEQCLRDQRHCSGNLGSMLGC